MLKEIDMEEFSRKERSRKELVLSKNARFANETVIEFANSGYDEAEVTGWPNDGIEAASKYQSLVRATKRAGLDGKVWPSMRNGHLLMVKKVRR